MYGLRLLRKPSVQLAVLALLATIALIFRALFFVALSREIQWGYDFSAYWFAALRVLTGESVYTAAQLAGPYAPQAQYLYLYPPPLAAAVAPLAGAFSADYRLAAGFWSALGALILGASVLALHRSERLGDRYPILAGRGRWLLVAGAFVFPPVVGELLIGNVHLVLLGLLTAAWLGVRRGDGRGSLVAGITTGLAAIVKVFPGLLFLWFAAARNWRAAAGVIVGAVIAAAATLPFTGIAPWLDYPTVLANLSAPSDTRDTLAPTVWLAEATGFTVARVIVTAVGLAIVAWAAWWLGAGTAVAKGQPVPDDLRAATARSFAVAVTVSVLIAPALYHHYLALLVLPLLLGLGAGVPLRYLALAYFLMWGGQQDALGDLSWVVNRALPTLGALVLLVGLVVRPRRSAETLTRASAPASA